MAFTYLPNKIIEKICCNLSIKDAIEMYNTYNIYIQNAIKYTFMDIIKNEKYLDKINGEPKYDEPGLKDCIRQQFYGKYKDEDLDYYSYIYPDSNTTILWNKFKTIAMYFSNHSKEWRDKQNNYIIKNGWNNYLSYAKLCILYRLPSEYFNQINKHGSTFMLKHNCIDNKSVKIWINKLSLFSLKEIKYITQFEFILGEFSIDTYDYFYQIKQKIPEADFLKFLKYSSQKFEDHGFTSIDMLFIIKLIIECNIKVNNAINIFKKLPEVFEGRKFKYDDNMDEPTEEMQRLINYYKK